MSETKNERITLPMSLAVTVMADLQKKYKIDHMKNVGNIGNPCSFSHEELAKIRTIDLKNPSAGDCKGLELLPNLENVIINSDRNHESDMRKFQSITNEDLSHIYKCKKLSMLSIRNQPGITAIDLGGLPKLSIAEICNNPQLETVTGLDKLPELETLECYGNESLWRIPNLNDAIKKWVSPKLKLDVNLFPSAIGFNPSTRGYDKNVVEKLNQQASSAPGEINGIYWFQNFDAQDNLDHLSRTRNIELGHGQMIKLHNTACQILDRIISPDVHKSDVEKVLAVERFLAEHVTYDDESIRPGRHRNNAHSNYEVGPSYGANGAYNCLVGQTCVCQGYSRGEQYLLSLLNIQSREISCTGKKDVIGFSDEQKEWSEEEAKKAKDMWATHSIIRIDDCYGLYSDPCWNSNRWHKGDKSMPYSLVTKSKISETHTLFRFDRDVVSLDKISPGRTTIEKSFASNEAFLKTKTAEVEEQRKQLGSKKPVFVRGMIAAGRA